MRLLLLDRPKNMDLFQGREVEFFGPWAQPIDSPEDLKKPNFEPYDIPDSIYQASLSIFDTTQDIFKRLAELMQDLTGVKTGQRFWRLYLSHYVLTLAIIVEDIKRRHYSLPEKDYTIGMSSKTNNIRLPYSWDDAEEQLFYGQDFRHRAITAYINNFYKKNELVEYQECKRKRLSSRFSDFYSRLICGELNILLKKAVSLLSLGKDQNVDNLSQDTSIAVWEVYHAEKFNFKQLKAYVFSEKLLPSIKSFPRFKVDIAKREIIRKILPAPYGELVSLSLPLLALEGLNYQFSILKRDIAPLFKNIKKIYTHGHVFEDNDPKRALISILAEENKEIISIQHGGGGGSYGVCSQLFLERTIADEYIAWGKGYSFSSGLSNTNRSKAIPSYYLSIIKKNSQSKRRNKIKFKNLIVVFEESRYVKYYYPSLFSDIAYDYFKRQKLLLDYFSGLTGTVIKVYPWDYGWGQAEWIKKKYPKTKIFVSGKFVNYAVGAELIIVDYNSTPFIEALAMNRPFLSTWNRKWFKGNTLFERCVDSLIGAGIFFENPSDLIEAYKQISSMGIEEWWQDKHRQDIVKAMANDFALTATEPEKYWLQEFNSH